MASVVQAKCKIQLCWQVQPLQRLGCPELVYSQPLTFNLNTVEWFKLTVLLISPTETVLPSKGTRQSIEHPSLGIVSPPVRNICSLFLPKLTSTLTQSKLTSHDGLVNSLPYLL